MPSLLSVLLPSEQESDFCPSKISEMQVWSYPTCLVASSKIRVGPAFRMHGHLISHTQPKQPLPQFLLWFSETPFVHQESAVLPARHGSHITSSPRPPTSLIWPVFCSPKCPLPVLKQAQCPQDACCRTLEFVAIHLNIPNRSTQ